MAVEAVSGGQDCLGRPSAACGSAGGACTQRREAAGNGRGSAGGPHLQPVLPNELHISYTATPFISMLGPTRFPLLLCRPPSARRRRGHAAAAASSPRSRPGGGLFCARLQRSRDPCAGSGCICQRARPHPCSSPGKQGSRVSERGARMCRHLPLPLPPPRLLVAAARHLVWPVIRSTLLQGCA